MASLASLLEDFRNYRGVQDWNLGRQEDQMLGHSEQARGLWQLLQGFGVGDVAGIGAIKAYHGSPHLFDKFDMSKIGTGEGAQAYGHGLYFAEKPEIADSYRKSVTGLHNASSAAFFDAKGNPVPRVDFSKPLGAAQHTLIATNGNYDEAMERLRQNIAEAANAGSFRESMIASAQKAMAALQKMQKQKHTLRMESGNLYETSLEWPDQAREAADPLGPGHFLDWDRSLIEQADFVKSAIKSMPFSLQGAEWHDPGHAFLTNNVHGEAALLKGGGSPSASAEFLKDFGVPGIRYLDQGSRWGGDGTYNYVVFDDQIPRIVARNGVPVRGLKGIVGQ